MEQDILEERVDFVTNGYLLLPQKTAYVRLRMSETKLWIIAKITVNFYYNYDKSWTKFFKLL